MTSACAASDPRPSAGAAIRFAETAYSEVTAVNNLTVSLGPFTAASAPASARVLLLIKEVDAATANTDYTFEVSRDNKTTHELATLTELGSAGNGLIWVQSGDIDLSGQPSGTTIWGRFKTLNNKTVELHGWKIDWAS